MSAAANVSSELTELNQLIQKVSTQIETIENSIDVTTDAEEKKNLREKEKQLWDKEKLLREKELLLLGKNQENSSILEQLKRIEGQLPKMQADLSQVQADLAPLPRIQEDLSALKLDAARRTPEQPLPIDLLVGCFSHVFASFLSYTGMSGTVHPLSTEPSLACPSVSSPTLCSSILSKPLLTSKPSIFVNSSPFGVANSGNAVYSSSSFSPASVSTSLYPDSLPVIQVCTPPTSPKSSLRYRLVTRTET